MLSERRETNENQNETKNTKTNYSRHVAIMSHIREYIEDQSIVGPLLPIKSNAYNKNNKWPMANIAKYH